MCAPLHYQPGNINSSKWKTHFFLHYTVMQAYWDEVTSTLKPASPQSVHLN